MPTTYGNVFLDNLDVPAALPTSPAFTVSASLLKVVIANATMTNYGTTSETFNIYIVPKGGAANDLSKTITSRSIDPKETMTLFELFNRPILEGGSIQSEASATTKLSLSIGGSEESAT